MCLLRAACEDSFWQSASRLAAQGRRAMRDRRSIRERDGQALRMPRPPELAFVELDLNGATEFEGLSRPLRMGQSSRER